MNYRRCPCGGQRRCNLSRDLPWMNLTEAARALRVSARTLRIAAEHGEISAEHPLPDGPWVFTRDALHTAAASAFLKRVALHRAGMAVPPPEQASLTIYQAHSFVGQHETRL